MTIVFIGRVRGPAWRVGELYVRGVCWAVGAIYVISVGDRAAADADSYADGTWLQQAWTESLNSYQIQHIFSNDDIIDILTEIIFETDKGVDSGTISDTLRLPEHFWRCCVARAFVADGTRASA